MAREWAAAIAKLKAGVDVERLASLLEEGEVAAALALVSGAAQVELFKRLQARTLLLRQLGWETAARETGQSVVALGEYAAQRPDVLALLRDVSLRRVTNLAAVQVSNAREVLTAGAKLGLNPRETAQALRETIGLHPRQTRAVMRFAARLTQAGEYSAGEVARYAGRQLTLRAETIARTETMQALNEGRRLVWGHLQAEGKLAGDEWEREWVIAPDERVCDECEPFDGVRAKVGEPFVAPTNESYGPPLHPRCRCVERMVPVDPKESS